MRRGQKANAWRKAISIGYGHLDAFQSGIHSLYQTYVKIPHLSPAHVYTIFIVVIVSKCPEELVIRHLQSGHVLDTWTRSALSLLPFSLEGFAMREDSYAKSELERNRQYRAAWESPEAKAWLESLSPEEREQLKRHGVDRPDLPSNRGNVRDSDLAESSLASEAADLPGHIAGTKSSDADSSGETRSDVLASFCARMRSCANPALVFDAVCYGTGVLAIEGQSATELAAKHGVTKQAFSKIAVQWCDTFGLPPARSMKSKRARTSYRERARRVHNLRKLTKQVEA